MKSRSLLFALCILCSCTIIFFACKKDIKSDPEPVIPTTNAFPIPAASPVTGSVSGLVVDENNQPVNNAEVRLGTLVTTTNTRGLFNFQTTTLDKYITTVTVTMPGYFKAYRSFCANPTKNYVSLKLLRRTLTGTINSSNAESISLSNNSTISFQANSVVVKATGAAYTGTVNVYAAYIDPTSTDINATVPGSFMAKDANNLYILASSGMMAVDLESATGEALQLAANKPATLKMFIPSSLLNKAPATIDTWSLNDQGIWIEEGTATKSGNYYEAQVTHFSFWNCDIPSNVVYLSLHIQDQNGIPLTNSLIELIAPPAASVWPVSSGLTDSLGNVSGLVPADYELTMNILPDAIVCNTPLSTQTIGPFTAANSTLTVAVTVPAAQQLTITGTVTDCSNQPLQNGTAFIYTGTYHYYITSIINGNYTISIAQSQCSAANGVEVTAINNSDGAQAVSGNIAVSGNSMAIPSLHVCNVVPAVFSMNTPSGMCPQSLLTGTYQTGIPMNSGNTATAYVNVTTAGTYSITTPTLNGISFSGSGVFTSLGLQQVILTATGTPLLAMGNEYNVTAPDGSYCFIYINVAAGPAAFEMGGPGSCSNISVAGNYYTNYPLTGSNNVSISVNVTTTGTYSITTPVVNGISFSGSGIFNTTGTQNIILTGQGSPANAGVATYTTQASNGGTGCSFDITTTSIQIAQMTFDCFGACSAGDCSSFAGGPPVTAGVPLNGNTLTFYVTVTSPGVWEVYTNSFNGFSYSGSGTFTSTGSQQVVLQGGGTPVGPSMLCFFTATQVGGGSSTCSALVNCN
ncbi:MAG: carboxypeptidase-like regulatory domain-containing protein [Ferruginibacter sp.]